MVDAWNSVGSWVLGTIAVGAGLAMLVFMFRTNYAKQTIEYLRGDRDDANIRAEGFEKDLKQEKEDRARERAEFQAQTLTYETSLSAKEQEIHILRNVVTGKEQLDRIERLLQSIQEDRFSTS